MQRQLANALGQALSEFLITLLWVAPFLTGCVWFVSRSIRHTQCLQHASWAASNLKAGRIESIPSAWILNDRLQWQRGNHEWLLSAKCTLQTVNWQIPDIE